MIWWIIWLAIFAGAIVTSNRLVPVEHQLNYAQCRKDIIYWLSFLLSSALWITAALQHIVGSDITFPVWMRVLGAVYMAAGYAYQIWAWRVNYFLVPAIVYIPPQVRVTTGPYRFCRHPFYAGCIFASIGTVCLLGQWWTLYPLIAYILLIIYRIHAENRILYRRHSL